MKKLLLIVMCIITGLFMVSCGSSSDNESSKVTKLDLKDANNNAKSNLNLSLHGASCETRPLFDGRLLPCQIT